MVLSKKTIFLVLFSLLSYSLFSQIDSIQSIQKINNVVGGLSGSPLGSNDGFGIGAEVIGDVNHDGIDDIAVGAYLDDDGGTDQGAVYILMLNADGTVKNQQKISETSGNGPNDFSNSNLYFGGDIAALGDLNGDGNVDIAVGMHGGGDDNSSGNYGAIYILFLDTNGVVLEFQKISDTEGGGTDQLDASDRMGLRVDNIGDLNGDGIPDLGVSAHHDDDGGSNRGAVYIVNLDYNGTAKKISKISDTAGGFTGVLDDVDIFGVGVTGLGDVDGDGVIDLAVGSIYDDDGGTDRGAVWILFMNTDGTVKSHQKISDIEGEFTGVLDDSDRFGDGLEAIGDMDGDGVTELLVGAYLDDDGGTNTGALWVLYLDTNGTVKSHDKISALNTNLSSEIAAEDKFARGISSFGDRNHDGKIDLLVGAHTAHDGSSVTGEVYVIHLEADITYPNKALHKTESFITDLEKFSGLLGEPLNTELGASDSYGHAITGIGDLDGDGIEDIIVGAQGDDDGGSGRGALYVQFLNADGSIKSYQKISDTQGSFTGTLSDGDLFGCSVANIGDLNNDGINDIVVGTYADDDGGTDRGAVWVLFLDTDGTVQSHQKISDTQGSFTGTLNNADRFGISVAGPGDIDGDGIEDIVVGARYNDNGGSNRGGVWVLFMDTDGTVQWHEKIAHGLASFTGPLDNGDMLGTGVASIGDMDGDGVPDIAVSAYADDDERTNTGAFYVLCLTDSGKVKSEQKVSASTGGFEGFIREDDFTGQSISGGYDLDLDGVNDILVNGTQNDNGGNNRGMTWVLFMNSDGTVKSHRSISSTSNMLVDLIDDSDFTGRSTAILNYNLQENTACIAIGAHQDDDGYTNAGAVYLLTVDLSVLQDYSNNIFIDTRSFSESIAYDLDLEGAAYSYTTGNIESILITDTSNTSTAAISVEANDNYGALNLLFDVVGKEISNVRVITDSLGSGDTLSLDSNFYTISSNGQLLTLYQNDTNELSTDSLLYGFKLQGGLGFSPDGDGDYDKLEILGLENIYYFNLTIKDLENTTVFYTEDKSDYWDGKYMGIGELVNRGAYQYTLNVNGETIEGQILLDY